MICLEMGVKILLGYSRRPIGVGCRRHPLRDGFPYTNDIRRDTPPLQGAWGVGQGKWTHKFYIWGRPPMLTGQAALVPVPPNLFR